MTAVERKNIIQDAGRDLPYTQSERIESKYRGKRDNPSIDFKQTFCNLLPFTTMWGLKNPTKTTKEKPPLGFNKRGRGEAYPVAEEIQKRCEQLPPAAPHDPGHGGIHACGRP